MGARVWQVERTRVACTTGSQEAKQMRADEPEQKSPRVNVSMLHFLNEWVRGRIARDMLLLLSQAPEKAYSLWDLAHAIGRPVSLVARVMPRLVAAGVVVPVRREGLVIYYLTGDAQVQRWLREWKNGRERQVPLCISLDGLGDVCSDGPFTMGGMARVTSRDRWGGPDGASIWGLHR